MSREPETARPPESPQERQLGFRDPKVLIAFGLSTLIWSSTWIVIKDQLGSDPETAVPPAWSVTYRFVLASVTMFALALVRRSPIALDRRTHLYAALLGLLQFFINYNSVYAAELYVTSGLVAVVFALLPAPNAILAFLVFGRRTSRAFVLGSILALAGVALLFLQEIRMSEAPAAAVALGLIFSLIAVLAASAANVMQLSGSLRARPIALARLGDAFGALLTRLCAGVRGPPVVESARLLGRPRLFGIVASAVAFCALLSGHPRGRPGPGRPIERAHPDSPWRSRLVAEAIAGPLAVRRRARPRRHGDRAAGGPPAGAGVAAGRLTRLETDRPAPTGASRACGIQRDNLI